MTPDVSAVLAQLSQVCLRSADPDLPAGQRTADLSLTAALLHVASEIWDGAAARLVDENQAIRVLLGIEGADDDLRIFALTAENHRLRAALIAAHAAAEAAADTARQGAIWAELVTSTERRKLSISLV